MHFETKKIRTTFRQKASPIFYSYHLFTYFTYFQKAVLALVNHRAFSQWWIYNHRGLFFGEYHFRGD